MRHIKSKNKVIRKMNINFDQGFNNNKKKKKKKKKKIHIINVY